MNWFVCRKARPQALVRLYCLPYAGGGASVFHSWPDAIPQDIEVHAVALPGRERRFGEDPGYTIAELADALAGHVIGPYALYGHSLGGRTAFEVIRHLRRTGGPQPVRLYVGGCRAPHLRVTGPFDGLSEVDDAELVRRVVGAGGVPAEVAAEPELMELLLPVLRADFTQVDRYVYRPEPPVGVPVVAFAGRSDDAVALADVRAWAVHTSADLVVHVLDGGHFFLRDKARQLLPMLAADLLAAVAGADT